MNLSRSELKNWWIEKQATVPCAVTNDGALVMFELADVEKVLNENYPHNGRVWWFNETKDREIAERRGSRVVANPQVLWRHFTSKAQKDVSLLDEALRRELNE